MSPLYNPAASTSAGKVDNGEDFFTEIGILSGMTQLVGADNTYPAFDSSNGGALTITDSVATAGAGTTVSWAGWNFSSASDRVLITGYMAPGLSGYIGLGVGSGTLPVGALQNSYTGFYDTSAGGSSIGRHLGGVFSQLATNNTCYQDNAATSTVWGMGLYMNGAANTQAFYVKGGSGQWFNILNTSDTNFSSFQCAFVRHGENYSRFMTPIYVWGS